MGCGILSALICVYRVSGANGRLQGKEPQINGDETADERRFTQRETNRAKYNH